MSANMLEQEGAWLRLTGRDDVGRVGKTRDGFGLPVSAAVWIDPRAEGLVCDDAPLSLDRRAA